MKKYILMPVLAALSLSGSVAQAQDFDNKPVHYCPVKVDK